MTKDEALRLALRAMVVNNQAWKYLADSGDAGNFDAEKQGYYQLNEQAITAIKAALEAKDEPVVTIDSLEQEIYENTRQFVSLDVMEWMLKRYYHTPPQQEAKDEPVGWAERGVINWLADKQFNHTSFLYATPSQRTWIGLTPEEEEEIITKAHSGAGWRFYIREAEAKLKDKNVPKT